MESLSLLGLLLVPGVGAVGCWLLGPTRPAVVRLLALGISLACLVMAISLTVAYLRLERPAVPLTGPVTFVPAFVPGATAEQPDVTSWTLLPLGEKGGLRFFLGVDGLNVWLVLLTAVLAVPSVLVSFEAVTQRGNEYYAWLLLLLASIFGTFLAFDLMLFYVFFETGLIPLFFLIGIWGGGQRAEAAKRYVITMLAGSLLSLLGLLMIVLICFGQTQTLTFSIPELVRTVSDLSRQDSYSLSLQTWVFLALSAGFAVKVPVFPLHTWQPFVYTEAPTAGNALLAGIILKLGCYGFLRLAIPLAPDAAWTVGLPLLTMLGAVSVVYGAFAAYGQSDIKTLLAYSSFSHLGLVMLGMFSLNVVGLQGSLVHMINHGLYTALLFLLVGMMIDRYQIRKIAAFSGMASRMPCFAALLVFAALASVGLPLLNGFVGEFLCLVGIYRYEASQGRTILPLLTVLGASGMVLGAWYLMTVLRRVLFGLVQEPQPEPDAVSAVGDLRPREWSLLAPLVLLCVVMGVYPAPVLKSTEPEIKRIGLLMQQAQERAKMPRVAQVN
ncbi:MAG: NADH-quinone oxidoreductase subunit M [Gemmataceae bacterium]